MSAESLDAMAREALAEHAAGLTQPIEALCRRAVLTLYSDGTVVFADSTDGQRIDWCCEALKSAAMARGFFPEGPRP